MEYLYKTVIAIVLIFSCKNNGLPAVQQEIFPDINHFKSFYEVFHRDSSYQMAHIQFPLEGVPEQSDTNFYANGFTWQKDQWKVHRLFNETDLSFKRIFRLVDSVLISETIYHQLSPMKLERRFAYNGDWNLIYYAPMRMPIEIEIK